MKKIIFISFVTSLFISCVTNPSSVLKKPSYETLAFPFAKNNEFIFNPRLTELNFNGMILGIDKTIKEDQFVRHVENKPDEKIDGVKLELYFSIENPYSEIFQIELPRYYNLIYNKDVVYTYHSRKDYQYYVDQIFYITEDEEYEISSVRNLGPIEGYHQKGGVHYFDFNPNEKKYYKIVFSIPVTRTSLILDGLSEKLSGTVNNEDNYFVMDFKQNIIIEHFIH